MQVFYIDKKNLTADAGDGTNMVSPLRRLLVEGGFAAAIVAEDEEAFTVVEHDGGVAVEGAEVFSARFE